MLRAAKAPYTECKVSRLRPINIKEVLELIKEVEVEVLKGKSKKRRITKAIIPKIEEKEKEDIKDDISKSKSNYIIIASSRLKSK
jgi:hypothetical protein